MKKIFEFVEKISFAYAIIYLIVLHIVVIAFIGTEELDFSKPIADIVLGYIGIVALFVICDLCFFIPSMAFIMFGSVVSFIMVISVPLFLFLATFQVLGSTIDVFEYGFIKTLLVCIIVTPIGFMNLKSLKILTL